MRASGRNQRVTPAAAAHFARIVSPNTAAALRTAPGAHHWRLVFLEFPANKDGSGDIIQIGDGSSAQSQTAQVPYEIVLDRVYMHGDPLYGQKRGIALNGRAVTIRNSYVSDIKGVGVDTQAIGGWNGPGPFSIENNYLEAAGEVILLGGADPAIPDLVSEDVLVRYNHVVTADGVARSDRGDARQAERRRRGRGFAGGRAPTPTGGGAPAGGAGLDRQFGTVAGDRRWRRREGR